MKDITLNILRVARSNPNLSALTYIEENVDYNKIPLAPLGTKILAHEVVDQHVTWGPNG